MSESFRVFLGVLPDVCPLDARRMVFTADAGGRCEVFAWDAETRTARRVTDRPGGTAHCAIDADAHVWWFEEDARGRGLWWYQPFDGGPRRPGLPGAPEGLPRGLAVTAGGTVATAVAPAPGTTRVLVGRRGHAPRTVLSVSKDLRLSGFTPEGDLLALAAAPADEAAVTVVTAAGAVAATLRPPAGARDEGGEAPGGIWCRGFSPLPGRRELLLVQELADGYALATWMPGGGLVTHRWCRFDTEITARWYPGSREVLVRQDRHGRSLLHRVALDTRTHRILPTPRGALLDAAPRPGGGLHLLWTDTLHPPVLRRVDDSEPPLPRPTDDSALPPPAGPLPQVPGRPVELWTPTPEGPVHTLLTLPDTGGDPAPPPAVFLVHGGPADQDRDAYDATVHSLVASGYAVARVNYRGSTGYGPRWRRALGSGVGHTQVEDLAAVRADLVRRRLVDERAVALWGVSWGGYLVLLALGTRPGLWQAGVAVKPVADWVTAHRTTTPALRALDVRWFGGTPEQVPERYASSSPLTYAAHVCAPLLVVGADKDVKCPPEQIRGYVSALRTAGVPHEEMWLDTGHDGYDGAAHVAVLRRALAFLGGHLPAPASAGPSRPPARPGGPRPR
ncbi:S9 family peptidase [Streptomyces anandii]|uniref:S9 family peptidase n=1 Tax=Streptomyces anandii TaxID=285454 RepID=UPI0016774169|nr:alpha/beta fold hydrolase [Streptomyces anandii]GGX77558.1 peptide hydrolase [Streptomyces anandii JCM 4720]